MSKLPSIQFYPGDWKKDIGIQSLDLHHRGLWFEMLLLMHESEERGKLLLNGRPMPHSAIARAVGLDIQTFNQNLTTLLELGVASVEEVTGIIYSRRMVRDERVRKAHAEAGKKGGNPALVNQKSTKLDNQTTNQNQTPSSSYSSSTSKNKKQTLVRFTSDDVDRIYEAYPRKVKPRAAKKAIESALRRLDGDHPGPGLLALTQAFARSPAGNREQFTPHPATWFNGSGYLDDQATWYQCDEPSRSPTTSRPVDPTVRFAPISTDAELLSDVRRRQAAGEPVTKAELKMADDIERQDALMKQLMNGVPA